jgi:DNA-binding NarL/FixJ family response regulator
MTIRVVLADDHKMFRETLRMRLAAEDDIEVVGETGTGAETLAAVERLLPDALVLDIALPGMSGMDVAREVCKRHQSAVKIVALSGYADRAFVEEMLKAGALAYVIKSSGAEELVAAIRATMAGHSFLSPELTRLMLPIMSAGQSATAPPNTVLGKREKQVLCLLAQGRRSAEIAAALGISTLTVAVHRRNIKQKLGLNTTAELTRYAIREGLSSV